MYSNDAEDPFQTYLGRAQVGLSEFGGAMDSEDSLDGDFCTPTNLSSSIQYINNTLDAFGFPPTLPDPSSSRTSGEETINISVDACVQLVNTLYSVLQKHQKDVDFRSDAADRVRRLQADKEQAVAASRRWEERTYAVEREIQLVVAIERKSEEKFRNLREKFEMEKDEATRQIAALQHRDSQAQHEIRKKEREYNRLQERLQHMLNERNREAKAGMDMLQTIQREGKKRAGWKTQGGKNVEDEMYKMIITTYEKKQQELVEETQCLRDSLRDLQGELQQLLNAPQPSKRVRSSDAATTPSKPTPAHLSPSSPLPPSHPLPSSTSSSLPLPPSSPFTSSGIPNEEFLSGQFDLPYSVARETVEERIRAQMRRYREVMSNQEPQSPTTVEDPLTPQQQQEIENKQTTIEEYKKIIEEQNELVQYLLKFSKSSTPLPLSPSSPSSSSSPPSSSSSTSTATAARPGSPSPAQSTHAHATPAHPARAIPAHAQTSPTRTLLTLYPTTPGPFRGMDDSRDELEERVFEREKELFEEKKRNFEEERQRVAEMALELAKERVELQELKQQLLTGGGSLSKPLKSYPLDSSLSESFISELEQVTLQNSMDTYFSQRIPPPSPISHNKQK